MKPQDLMNILNSEGSCEECILNKSEFPKCSKSAPYKYDDFYILEQIKINKRRKL